MAIRMRRAAGLAGVAFALVVAGCHRKPPEPSPAADEDNAGVEAPLSPAPPPAPVQAPPPAPMPAPTPPSAPTPPPPPPVSHDQQMLDDAAASGMTAPIERGNDEAAPAAAEDHSGDSSNGG